MKIYLKDEDMQRGYGDCALVLRSDGNVEMEEIIGSIESYIEELDKDMPVFFDEVAKKWYYEVEND